MAKNLNRVLAFGIAASMVFGSSLTAFAEPNTATSGTAASITGSGTEVNAKTDVFSVELPTSDALTGTLKYIVDPEGVVAASKAAFGADVTVNDNNGVMFKNVDGTNVSVSGTSDKLTVTNKSYKPVDFEITFSCAEAEGYNAGLSTTEDFSGTGDEAKGLYFGVIAGNEAEKAFSVIGSGTASKFVNVIKSDKDEYELKGTNSGSSTTYAYTLKTDAKGVDYSFQIKAAMNKNLPITTWQTTASDGTVTAKAVPQITMTFKPTQNTSVMAQAKWNSSWGIDFALPAGTAEDGGLVAKPTVVKWNGKEVKLENVTLKDNGWATISWAGIIDAYNTAEGTEYTSSKYDDAIWKGTNVVQFTATNGAATSAATQAYIADVK